MKINDLLFYSFRNLLRSKGRVVLAAMATAIGVFAIVIISSLGSGGKQLIMKEIDRIGLQGLTVYSSNTAISLNDETIAIAESVSGVKDAMPIMLEYRYFSARNITGNCMLWGVTEQLADIMNLDLLYGRFFTKTDLSGATKTIIIDDTLAQKIYGRVNVIGQTMNLSFSTGTESFTIIGIISSQKAGIDQLLGETLPQFIYLPYSTLENLTGRIYYDQLAISCFSDEEPEQVGQSVVDRLNRTIGETNIYQYQNISSYADNLNTITEIVTLLISAIAAISLLVAGLCVMNSMLFSASERKQEIGICMAIGAKESDILKCFLIESAFVAGMGGIIGILAAVVCAWSCQFLLGMPFSLNWIVILSAEIGAVFIGILFGMLPAKKAAHLDPILALRNQ